MIPRTASRLALAGLLATALPGATVAQDFLGGTPDGALLSGKAGVVPVFGPGNDQLGDVENVVLGFDGRILAVVVGVGGRLGMGERLVAVPMDAATFSRRDGEVRLDITLTKAQLDAAPRFDPEDG